ncbi:hypothetical protein EDB81DRAFT_814388 [Dactylonectria macrodidyma]|uniref:Uncharacterized protein n=1 Tax=Dactylonectria macrodidyma TaxID=307937 RepID=A0A9P9DJY2_9HYPO|nr:hypothetical protein EDB81DRAFT_814388 [Dactylonectria macrodidyma]
MAGITHEPEDGVNPMHFGLYEAGGEEGSGFHVFNIAPNHYHRAEVLQRSGAIDITCDLERVLHGAMSADSDYYATLMVMHWSFKAKNTRRISEANIELLFEPGLSGSDIEVEQVSFKDTYSLMPTTQQESITQGGEANIGVAYGASIGVGAKWEKTVSAEKTDAITLYGVRQLVNNIPPYRIARWIVSENETQPAGIPASLKVAVLVSRQDREQFTCKVGFSCKTDRKTAVQSLFKKIPKDDPIIFQPNPRDKGTRPSRNVSYGHDELGSVDIDEYCDVTFRTIIKDGQKVWK